MNSPRVRTLQPPHVPAPVVIRECHVKWLEAFGSALRDGLTDAELADRECVTLSAVRVAETRLYRMAGITGPKGNLSARGALVRWAQSWLLVPLFPIAPLVKSGGKR